jgi:hypothetical protein
MEVFVDFDGLTDYAWAIGPDVDYNFYFAKVDMYFVSAECSANFVR